MREKSIKDLKVKKLVLFRALHLGDLLTALPAIRSFRKNFPDAEITLVGLPWAESFAKRFDQYMDRFIEFPGFPGLPERTFHPRAFTNFLSKVQEENFDLAVQMQGSGHISNQIIALWGAKNTAGFYAAGNYKPNDDFFVRYPDNGHETERFLKLIRALGLETDGTKGKFPVFEAEVKAAEKLLAKNNLQEGKFVCIHTGSREKARRWGTDNFAVIADYICSKGFKVVFTGVDQERKFVYRTRKKMKSSSVNFCGYTGLGELAVILQKSALLVSNDTGAVHVAVAQGADSVIIYTKEKADLVRWAPLDRKKHAVIEPERSKNVGNVKKEIDNKLRTESSGRKRKKRAYEHARAV